MSKCEICNADVLELRRGRCWGCYNRWVDARPVGYGARCVLCGEQRRDRLKSVELLGGWWPTCFTCAGQAAQLSPMPQSMTELRRAICRDRRQADRRVGRADWRVHQPERRHQARRAGRAAQDAGAGDTLPADAIAEILDGVLEAARLAEAESRAGARAEARAEDRPRGKPGRPTRPAADDDLTQIRAFGAA